MTGYEIIKALECCCEAQNCTLCKYEPTEYRKGSIGCCNELMKNAVDLINRQNAEIERLKRSLDNMTGSLIRTDDYCRDLECKGGKDNG
jgi:hypothetical protein